MADGSHLTVKVYKHAVHNGGSQPHVIGLSDGHDYLVKFKGNPQGTRVLANEYVANELIAKLQFEGARGKIIIADAFFISKEPNLQNRNLEAGHQFASPYFKHHDNFSNSILAHLENRNDLPQVIVLDNFICNNDRGSGNLLLVFNDPSKPDCRFVLVDQGHAFGGPNWDQHSLKTLQDNATLHVNAGIFPDIPYKMDVFEPLLIRLEALTRDEIEAIIDGVPSDWGLHSADRNALLDFLVARKDKVRNILQTHLAASLSAHVS